MNLMSVTAAPIRRLIWTALLCLAAGLSGCTSGHPAETTQDVSSASPSSMTSRTPSDSPSREPNVPESPGAAAKSAGDEAVAMIGGKPITLSELMRRLISGYGAEVLREMMLREAVKLESARVGITVADGELDQELRRMSEGYESEQAFYAQMLQQLGMDRSAVREDASYRLLLEKLATRDIRIPEADIRHYYDEHQQDFGPRMQFKLAWILTGDKEESNAMLGKLAEGEDFATLAEQFSIDSMTAEQGGDLGWVDDLDPFQDVKLLETVRQMKVGEAEGPIRTEQGYAIVELRGEKRIEGKPFASVREEIRRMLALEQVPSLHDLEEALLARYDARVFDSMLEVPKGK